MSNTQIVCARSHGASRALEWGAAPVQSSGQHGSEWTQHLQEMQKIREHRRRAGNVSSTETRQMEQILSDWL